MSVPPPLILDIHTPSASFSIVHSLTQESLSDLYDKLTRKLGTDYHAEQVTSGWLKYEYNDSIWNLDDDSDYAIFTWRTQHDTSAEPDIEPIASSSKTIDLSRPTQPLQQPKNTPTLHLQNPRNPLPPLSEYCNPSYYVFRARTQRAEAQSRRGSRKSPVPSSKSKKGKVVGLEDDSSEDDGVPKFKKQFNRFHEENGVRTVIGSIGSVQNVRMLLKPSYRHVYMSRRFAIRHSFLPIDAAPGHYGYGGLISIGKWPITLVPSAAQPPRRPTPHRRPDVSDHPSSLWSPSIAAQNSNPRQLAASRIPSSTLAASSILVSPNRNETGTKGVRRAKKSMTESTSGQRGAKPDRKTITMDVYLSEEPHFDVVLGRSFIEKRQVKLSTIDPTDVVCLDTGEKIECELVILKDGRGEIVTVT